MASAPQSGSSASLDSDKYLASPIATILGSIDDPQSEIITLHDLAEAYSTLSRRIRLQATQATVTTQTPPALTLFAIHNASLSLCLIRDISRCLLNPLSIFSQDSVPWNAIAREEVMERAQAYATLSHHALVFLSDVFSIVAIMNTFLDDQLKDLLRELLSLLSAHHLPTPSSKKSWDLAILVLVSQRLSPAVLLSQKQKFQNVLDRLLRGNFGGSLRRSEGLKLYPALLRSEPSEFMGALLPLYPTILALSTNDAFDVRFQTLKTLCCITVLKLDIPDTPWSRRIALHTHNFIKSEMIKSKASQDGSFQHILSSAMQGSQESWKAKGPLWASLMVACLICLSDAELFIHPHSLKLFLTLLGRATNHKHTYVRALHPHIWICLVWCYSRLPDPTEGPKALGATDIKNRAFLVLRQELKGGIATALIASQLSDVSCPSSKIVAVLHIIKDLLSSSKESQIREGINILGRLVCDVGTSSSADSQNTTRDFSQVVHRNLFADSLIGLPEKQARTLINRFPTPDTQFIRPLTEDQIRKHWEEFLQLWVYSVNCTHTSSTDYKYYETQLLNIWQSLLLVRSQLEPTTALLSVSPPPAECIKSTFIDFIVQTDSLSDQRRQLNLVYELWMVTKQSYGTQYLVSLAEAILFAVLKEKYDLDEEGVKHAWNLLFVDLVSIGVPDFLPSVLARSESQEGVEVQRQLWVMMAKNDLIVPKADDWEEFLSFLVVPLQSWNLDTQDVKLWNRSLSQAIEVARSSLTTLVGFINHLLKRLGSQKIKSLQFCPGTIPTLLTCLHFCSESVLHSDLLSTVDTFLVDIYPPSPENHVLALSIFDGVAHLVSTCDEKDIVQLLVLLKESLRLWFKDDEKSLLQQEHNALIDNIYRVSLDVLSNAAPSIEILQALSSYLASSFERMGYPPIGPLAFEKFWRKSYHDQPESFKRLIPEDLKTCLKAWSDHCGDSLAEGLADDTQSTERSIVSDSQSPRKAVAVSGGHKLSRVVEMGSDDSYHFISTSSSPEDARRTPTAGGRRLSVMELPPHLYELDDLIGSHGSKRPVAESTPKPQKRRRAEKSGSFASVVSVSQDQKSYVAKKSSLEVIESPEALPRSSTSLVTPPRLPRYRPDQTLVPPLLGIDDYVLGTPTRPPVTRKVGTNKRVTQLMDDDLDEMIEDSTEMDRLFAPLNKDHDIQVSGSPDDLVPRPSANKRLQSEPAYESGFPSRPMPLRRSHTTSERLDALEHAYDAVAESQGASQVPIEELARAANLAHKIGAKITEQLNKKLHTTRD